MVFTRNIFMDPNERGHEINGSTVGVAQRDDGLEAMVLSPAEKKVLQELGRTDDWVVLSFQKIADKTKLDQTQVGSACRGLRFKGLATYESGGAVGGGFSGSGYMISSHGRKALAGMNQEP